MNKSNRTRKVCFFKLKIHFIFLLLCTIALNLLPFLANAASDDPEIPLIERPVHITDQSRYELPYVPVFRTTRDGRLSYNTEGSPLEFYLNNPEKINEVYTDGANGPALLATTRPFNVNKEQLRDGNFSSNAHAAVCEVPNADGSQKSPYACGDDDCYDLVLIDAGAPTAARNTRVLYGTPATIRVSNPKTPQARIASVDIGETVTSPHAFTYGQLFEPMTTQDGNLLIGRVSGSRFTWRNSRTNRNVSASYDMVYFPAPDNPASACDVTQWDEIKPMGHAPYDPEINTRYGFAKQLFRDATGQVVPDNSRLGGTYPWIDSLGNNIMFATGSTNISRDFPLSCVPDRGCNDANFGGNPPLMNRVIVGLWTNGKMVMLDNMVNNIDYSGTPTEDNGHRMADMYLAGSRENGSGSGLVRLGNGRDQGYTANIAGHSGNTTFQESIENKLNYWENMRPVKPGDVVWKISSGAASDEFRFDDHQYLNSFIISSMTQATRNDGRTVTNFNGLNNANVLVQNAATSSRWNVPGFGSVSNGRIERVALGGIFGKGLWMRGNTRVEYELPRQGIFQRSRDWHISLFIDPRFDNDNTVRNLISFSDGTELQLQGLDRIRFWQGSPFSTVTLPEALPRNAWTHIGVQMTNGNQNATLYINGFAAATVTRRNGDGRFFEFFAGTMNVGDNPNRDVAGFKGWIDDFKVIAHETNQENWCVHANGILVGSDSNSGEWANIAASYPDFAHQELTQILNASGKQSYSQYACYVDYSDDFAAHRDNIPNGFH